MQLSFYGAAGEVTGSNYHLATERSTILIDCGAFQGGKDAELKNAAPFLFDPHRIDALVLTHAHLDHVGRLGKLVADGFRGPIYATPATKDLAELIMLDSVKIMSHEELKFGDAPLYREDDVAQAMSQFQSLEYKIRQTAADGVEIRLVDAGHILGSASVEVWAEGKKLAFSGDLGNEGAPIIRDPEPITEADLVICESTYGGKTHEPPQERAAVLKEAITRTVAQRGTLLIPAFALERTQELLHTLDELVEHNRIPDLAIFLDSPLAIKATRVFTKYRRYYDEEASLQVMAGEDFFRMPGLTWTETVEQSKAINQAPRPKVIIAGSGMMAGGRIIHHLKGAIEDPTTTILFVGFQAQGTLGRRLRDGVKQVDLFHEPHQVRAQMMECGAFSAHADQPHLLEWLGAIQSPVERVFLTHGEPKAAVALGEAVSSQQKRQVHIPRFGEHVTM